MSMHDFVLFIAGQQISTMLVALLACVVVYLFVRARVIEYRAACRCAREFANLTAGVFDVNNIITVIELGKQFIEQDFKTLPAKTIAKNIGHLMLDVGQTVGPTADMCVIAARAQRMLRELKRTGYHNAVLHSAVRRTTPTVGDRTILDFINEDKAEYTCGKRLWTYIRTFVWPLIR